MDQRPSRLRALPGPDEAVTEAPDAPGHLGPVGQEVWTDLWDTGHYRPTDVYAVERYAELQERRAGLLTTLAVEGWTMVGHRGVPTVRPVARLLRDVQAKLLPLEDRLGLTPESRSRPVTCPTPVRQPRGGRTLPRRRRPEHSFQQ